MTSSDRSFEAHALDELPLAPDAIRKATGLALANPAVVDTDRRVFAHVRSHALSAPAQTAVVEGEKSLNYRQFVERVEAIEELLLAKGCSPGDIVACLGRRSADSPAVFLALENIGAVYLPVDPGWPATRIAEVIELSACAFRLDYTGTLAVDRLRDGAGPRPFDGLSGDSTPRYVIYTSGTTGKPKGAVVEQAGMLNHLWAKVWDLSLTADDSVAFTAPLVFDISIWQMLAPLMAGGTVVVATDDDLLFPRKTHNLLRDRAVSVVELVPTAIGALIDAMTRRGPGGALPSLRWLVSTGEELKPALAERILTVLPEVLLLNAYGPTECSDDVTHHVVTAADTAGNRLPVGRPIVNAVLYVLVHNLETGQWDAARLGEPGEIFVGGLPVGRGYLGDHAATAKAFFHDRFDPHSPTGRLYRTGDLGRISQGTVHYLGRLDRQVKVGGIRLELDEVEAILSRHHAINQCAVIMKLKAGRPELVAYYSALHEIGSADLESCLRQELPTAAVPRKWIPLDSLPLTANGKIDYRTLSDL